MTQNCPHWPTLAPAKKKSRDIYPVSPTFCISAAVHIVGWAPAGGTMHKRFAWNDKNANTPVITSARKKNTKVTTCTCQCCRLNWKFSCFGPGSGGTVQWRFKSGWWHTSNMYNSNSRPNFRLTLYHQKRISTLLLGSLMYGVFKI